MITVTCNVAVAADIPCSVASHSRQSVGGRAVSDSVYQSWVPSATNAYVHSEVVTLAGTLRLRTCFCAVPTGARVVAIFGMSARAWRHSYTRSDRNVRGFLIIRPSFRPRNEVNAIRLGPDGPKMSISETLYRRCRDFGWLCVRATVPAAVLLVVAGGGAAGGQLSDRLSGWASIKPCRTDHIGVARRGQVDGILGVTVVDVALRNDARESCVLSGYPGVILLGALRQHVGLKVIHGELGPKEPRKVQRIVLDGRHGGAMFAISFVDHPGPAPQKDCRAFAYLLSSLPGHRMKSLTYAGPNLEVCGGRHGPAVELSPIGKM